MHFVLETRKFLDGLCVKHEVECPAPRTVARLLDKVCLINLLPDLYSHTVTPTVIHDLTTLPILSATQLKKTQNLKELLFKNRGIIEKTKLMY